MSEGVTVVTGAVEGFDYGTLDSETRIVVQQRTGEIRSLVRRSAQDVVDIGVKLGEVKQRLGHGGFGKWLATEFEWTQETARRFMRVAAMQQDGFTFVATEELNRIGVSALYVLCAPSAPHRALVTAVNLAKAGVPVTHAMAKRIVAGENRPAVEGNWKVLARKPMAPGQSFLSEVEMEDSFVCFLEQNGIGFGRQVSCGAGVIDVLTDNEIIELKFLPSRTDFFKAIGQLMLYGVAMGGDRKRVIVYCDNGRCNVDDLTGYAQEIGVEVVLWNK